MRAILLLFLLITLVSGLYAWIPVVRIATHCIAAADRTSCYEQEVPDLYPRFSRDDIFDALRLLQRADPAAAACHQIAHRVAEAVVRHEPARWSDEFTVVEGHRLCSFGYVHGVAIAAMRHARVDMGDRALSELPGRCEVLSGRARSNCFHGLGHLFYYAYDTTRALARCDESTNDDHLRTRCHAGVVMSVFFVTPDDPDPDRQRVTLMDAPEFCASLGGQYESECRRTSWIIAPDTLRSRGAIESFCAGIPDDPDACFARVFRGLAWLDPADRIVHEQVCDEFSDPLHDECIAAGAIEYALATGELGPARARCNAAHDPHACIEGLDW
jgi:hypothetical protein